MESKMAVKTAPKTTREVFSTQPVGTIKSFMDQLKINTFAEKLIEEGLTLKQEKNWQELFPALRQLPQAPKFKQAISNLAIFNTIIIRFIKELHTQFKKWYLNLE